MATVMSAPPMPIDKQKLLAFPIPPGRQRLTPREVAYYALSIGMGCNPLDREALRFVDPLRGPEVMPTMVLVMAHPGFWLAHAESGVDPKAVLHASQSFEIVAPLPREGVVQSSTRITRLIDKGPGKAALILTATDLTNEAGELFARLDRTIFVRNGGGFGGSGESPAKPRRANPAQPPDYVIDLPTRPEQALLYRLNGDYNPLHSDPDVAAGAGFAGPILHGLCTMGVVGHAILRTLAAHQPERMHSMSLRFCSAVMPGETIRTEIWEDGRFQARALERDILVVDTGSASVHPVTSSTTTEHLN